MHARRNRSQSLFIAVLFAAACGSQQGGDTGNVHQPGEPRSGALTSSGPEILSQRGDASRTGWNSSETILTPANVNSATFGKLYTLPVDGYVYAQPLYKANVTISGTAHNVLVVATQHDSVYAFDADVGTSLWHTSFINPPTVTTQPSADTGTTDIIPEVGITSTPVIDPVTGTIFVVSKTKESGTPFYRIHALDITTGAERQPSVKILPSVSGTGSGSSGGTITLNAAWQQQRPGLVLVNGVVYVCFGSSGDNFTWHGWIVGYRASDLTQVSVLNTTPNGTSSGVWMSGEAPPADAAGNLYIVTGNGDFDGLNQFGDSLLKVQTSPALQIINFFAPFNQQALSNADLDFASAGVTLLPDVAGTTAHPHILVTSGKTGTIYVLDRDVLGGYRSSYTNPDSQIIQEIWNALGTSPINNTAASLPYVENSYSTPAFFRDASGVNHLYFGGVGDKVKAFNFVNGLLTTTPVSTSSASYGFPGASPVGSSNGTSNAIVWTYERGSSVAILHAYDPQNLANEFYNSGQAANNRDQAGAPVKFCVPSVTNGHVYIGVQSGVTVYGLLSSAPPQAAAPTFSPGPGTYTSTVNVTLSSSTPGAAIHYTTDGSLPSISSPVYTNPIPVSSTTSINAVAIANGFLDSQFSTGTFTIGAVAPIAFVQGTNAVPQTPQTSLAVGYAGTQTAGNLNVVIISWNGSLSVTSVTDTVGNTYALAVGPTINSTSNDHQSIYYARNIAAAAPNANLVTVNFSGAVNYPDLRILEYSGLDSTNPLDVAVGSSGNSASSSSGAITTATANELLVSGNVVATSTSGAGTGFTSRMITNPDGDIAEDQIVTAVGSYTATAPLSSAGTWVMQIAAFKRGAVTPPTPPTPPSGLTATASSSTQIDLAWTNTSATQTGVKVESSPDNVTFTQIAQVAGTATSYSNTGLTPSTTRYYRVRATNSAGDSGYSNTASATTQAPPPPPTAPTNLTATAASSTQINLTWTNTSTATNVTVERSADNVTFVLINTLAGTAQSYSDTGLTPSTTYWYRVRAANSAGNSPYSNTATTTTQAPAPPPTAPVNLTATAVSSNQINLAWTNTSTSQTGVKVERSPDGVNFLQIAVAAATATSYSDTGLTASTTYTYRVRATSGTGDSPYSNTASATTQTQVATLAFVQANSADPQSSASVAVTYTTAQGAGDLNVVIVGWNDSTSTVSSVADSSGNVYTLAVGPTVQAGTATQSIYFAKNIKAAAAGANTVTVTFNTAAAFPDIRILEYSGVDQTSPVDGAIAATGNSASSSTAAITTTNAHDLLVAGNTIQTSTTGPGAGFTTRVLTNPDSDIAEDQIVSTAGSYSATAPVSPAGLWVMQMVAFKAASVAPPPPPPPPTGLAAKAISTSEIDLSWTNGSTNQTGVKIERSPDGVAYTQIAIAAATATSYADTGLIAAVTYYYRVRATNGTTDSTYTAVASATTLPLSPPGSPAATAASSSQINLSWVNTNPNHTGTKIERSTDGVTFTQITVAASGAISYSDTGLAVSTTYYYRLRATNFTTDSPYTSVVSAITQPLAAPSGLTATAVSSAEIDLAWTNSNTNQTGVKIERSTDGVTFALITTAAATATAYQDKGLSPSTSYYYRVRATNGVVDSVNSAVVSATTPAPAPTPTPPSNLTASASSNSQINLTWTNTSPTGGQTGVKIERSPDGLTFTQIALTTSASAATYSDTGLAAGTTYYYRVRATNGVVDSAYSTVANATTQPLVAPSGLAATAASSTAINLAWTNNNSNQTGVKIERSPDGVTFTQIALTASGTVATYSDTGLTAATTYYYRVRATNGATNSAYSTVASATTQTLAAPSGLSATAASTTAINLAWTNNSTSQTGVKIERSPDGVTFTQIALTASGTVTTYSDTGLTAATTYYYRVRATNGTINSAYSSVASAKTLSGAPATIAFVQVNSADPQSPQTSVSVTYSTAQAAGDLNVVIVGWNDSTSTVSSVTDTKGNVYTLAVGPTVQAGVATQSIYYAKNIAASAAGTNVVKVQFSVAANFPDIRILEYSGIDPTAPLDVTAASSGSSATASSGAVSTTNPNDLLVGANVVQTGTTGAGTSFTSRVITNPDADIAEDRVVSAAGSYSATAPVSPAAQWIMQMVAFKAAIH